MLQPCCRYVVIFRYSSQSSMGRWMFKWATESAAKAASAEQVETSAQPVASCFGSIHGSAAAISKCHSNVVEGPVCNTCQCSAVNCHSCCDYLPLLIAAISAAMSVSLFLIASSTSAARRLSIIVERISAIMDRLRCRLTGAGLHGTRFVATCPNVRQCHGRDHYTIQRVL